MVLLKKEEEIRNLFRSKKGELTTKQLITIIVLIASFVIILFLFFRLNLGETNNKEICHNSVLLQEKGSLFGGPLDCRTDYLCVSAGGECESITETSTADVSVGEGLKEEVMSVLAEEMADCWWMFGEGEVNYGESDVVGRNTEYAICSIVSFDDNIQGNVPGISYSDFYDYLRTTSKSGSQTYLQYIYGTNVIEGIDEEEMVDFSFSESIDTSRRYSIITGIDNRAGTKESINPDLILKVYMIPTSETSERLSTPRKFITKA
ncbi:MAG: hypothetical protein WDZ69_03075 [Candidatus Pacearchaeota archaeon]